MAVAFGSGALIGAAATAMYFKRQQPETEVEPMVQDVEEIPEGVNETSKKGDQASNEKDDDAHLHWHRGLEPRGLQPLLHQLNHVALVVRDVGQSLFFYSDIIGFQQIRRPNFDRHGAWLTMGNVELHLIKGEPACHRGQHPSDLIVSHLAIEVKDSDKVLERLRKLKAEEFTNLTWRQNISVPTPDASRSEKFESNHTTSKGKVTQFFLEDPDGYWLELCNCDVLTAFCFGHDDANSATHPVFRYEEGCHGKALHSIADMTIQATRWVKKAITNNKKMDELVNKIDNCTPVPLDQVNETYLNNLVKRRNTYGDICQGFSEEDLANALAKTGNDVPMALVLLKQASVSLGQEFFPPSYLVESAETSHNKPFKMPVHHDMQEWGRVHHKRDRDEEGRRGSIKSFAHQFVSEERQAGGNTLLEARQAS